MSKPVQFCHAIYCAAQFHVVAGALKSRRRSSGQSVMRVDDRTR